MGGGGGVAEAEKKADKRRRVFFYIGGSKGKKGLFFISSRVSEKLWKKRKEIVLETEGKNLERESEQYESKLS